MGDQRKPQISVLICIIIHGENSCGILDALAKYELCRSNFAKEREISTIYVAFRPALLQKSLNSIGVLQKFNLTAAMVYTMIGEKEMTKAYTKLITIDKKFTNEFNMIQELNKLYRIANMDISTVPKKFNMIDMVLLELEDECLLLLQQQITTIVWL